MFKMKEETRNYLINLIMNKLLEQGIIVVYQFPIAVPRVSSILFSPTP